MTISVQDRIRIALLDGPGTASEIASELELPAPEVGVRLRALKRDGYTSVIGQKPLIYSLTQRGVAKARTAQARVDLESWMKWTAERGM